MKKFLLAALAVFVTLPAIAGVKIVDGDTFYNVPRLEVPKGSAKRVDGGSKVIFGGAYKGTPGTAAGITVDEDGFGKDRVVTINLKNTPVATVAGGAAEANGVLLYTFPAGVQYKEIVYMDLAVDGPSAVAADTPDCGFGTVKASGAVALLSGTATFEDLLTGQTMTDTNGTAAIASDLNVDALSAVGAAKTVNFNCADTWAAGGGAITATGKFVVKFTQL